MMTTLIFLKKRVETIKIVRHDKKYRFVSTFDTDTGFYARSGILDKHCRDTGIDPFMASYPELIDIGICGSCAHGLSGLCLQAGVECYQSGPIVQKPDMSLENFKRIIDESEGKVFQVALGGRGDPDQHKNFKKILQYSRSKNIVPNFTSSGLGFNEEIVDLCKQFCGAVAISWYRAPFTIKALEMLIQAGVTTNIHYVLSNSTIDEAITRLKDPNGFPSGINAVIFLLHKPVGLGSQENVLNVEDPRVEEFFSIIDLNQTPYMIGFDSCSIPGILNLTKNIDRMSIDTCEGARFSMYISSDMKALPCSFDQRHKWAFDLSNGTIQEAWDSEQFNDFRNHLASSCPGCPDRRECGGGCPIKNEIVLCKRPERNAV
jgi:radical SAM protein with 4Fe4S-binding SPASM domain